MTQEKSTAGRVTRKALVAGDQDFVRHLVHEVTQEILEAEMTDALGAEPYAV
jgi:transposase-like protein